MKTKILAATVTPVLCILLGIAIFFVVLHHRRRRDRNEIREIDSSDATEVYEKDVPGATRLEMDDGAPRAVEVWAPPSELSGAFVPPKARAGVPALRVSEYSERGAGADRNGYHLATMTREGRREEGGWI
jgi:hypothetical protein